MAGNYNKFSKDGDGDDRKEQEENSQNDSHTESDDDNYNDAIKYRNRMIYYLSTDETCFAMPRIIHVVSSYSFGRNKTPVTESDESDESDESEESEESEAEQNTSDDDNSVGEEQAANIQDLTDENNDDNATGDYATGDNATGDDATGDNATDDNATDDNATGDNEPQQSTSHENKDVKERDQAQPALDGQIQPTSKEDEEAKETDEQSMVNQPKNTTDEPNQPPQSSDDSDDSEVNLILFAREMQELFLEAIKQEEYKMLKHTLQVKKMYNKKKRQMRRFDLEDADLTSDSDEEEYFKDIKKFFQDFDPKK